MAGYAVTYSDMCVGLVSFTDAGDASYAYNPSPPMKHKKEINWACHIKRQLC